MIDRIIKTPWHFMRWVRLIAGAGIIFGAIINHDNLSLLLGGVFLFQSVFNVGCCSSSACYTPTETKNKTTSDTKEIEFEEIK